MRSQLIHHLPSVLLVLAMLCLPATPARAELARAWPDFPTPSGSNVGWIAQDVVYNGIPMQIRDMKSSAPPQDIVAFYRKQWQKTPKDKLILEKKAPWYLIHRFTDTIFYTVEVRPLREGSQAILTMSRLPEILQQLKHNGGSMQALIAAQGEGFPKLPGSKMVMDMSSYDPGIQARTIMYRNTYDVETNALHVAEDLINSGWTKTGDYRSGKADMGRQLVFKRNEEQIMMTIRQADGATEIVANQTKPLAGGKNQ